MSTNENLPFLKCVIVGDAKVGKSSLNVTLFKGTFPQHFGGDNAHGDYTVHTNVDGVEYAVRLFDTISPGKDHQDLRLLAYHGN